MKNFIIRTISGLLFISAMLLSLMVNKYIFCVTSMIALSVMMYEFFRMTMGPQYKYSQILTIFAACLLFLLTFSYRAFDVPGRFSILAFVPFFIVMINSLYIKEKKNFGLFSNLYTALIYILVPIALSNFAVFREPKVFDGKLLLSIYIIIWSTDVGGYMFGSTLGQKFGKKLLPDVSPKKSWVGYWGGLIVAIVASVLLHYTGVIPFKLLHCIILGILINVSGVYGDLVESQWKRHYAIKDTGNIMPGHGGILDRFDSALFAIPAAVIYLVILDLI